MVKLEIIALALGIFLLMTFIFYHIMRSYVKEEFGKKWLTLWGNKLYFWQSLLFMSGASTVVLMALLKWAQLLTF